MNPYQMARRSRKARTLADGALDAAGICSVVAVQMNADQITLCAKLAGVNLPSAEAWKETLENLRSMEVIRARVREFDQMKGAA